MSQAGTLLLTGGGGGGSGTVTDVMGGTNITITGTPTVNPIVNVSGPPSPTTYTLNGVLYGNTTGPIQVTAAGTTGQVLLGVTDGAPVFGTVPLPTFVASITAGNNITLTGTATNPIVNVSGPPTPTTYTLNGVLYGNTTGNLQVTAAGVTGQVLLGNTASAPTWGIVPLPVTVPLQFTENGPTIAIPSSNNINIFGTGAISTSGAGSTVTVTSTAVTSFQLDKNDATITTINAFAGTVTPASNVLRLGGDNGIVTNQTAVAGSIIIDFVRGSVQSTDGSQYTGLTYNLTNNSVLIMQVIVAGRDTTSGDGVGGYCTCVVKNIAGTATIITTPDVIINRDASLAGATFTVGVSGASFVVQVTGVAGHTIDWVVCLPGIDSA